MCYNSNNNNLKKIDIFNYTLMFILLNIKDLKYWLER